MHVVDFLKSADLTIPPVVVVTGQQRYFKSLAVQRLREAVIDNDDTSLSRFPGKETELPIVCDELRTVSMWGDRRLVIVEDADEFISKNRNGLEKYVEAPAKKGVLVLDVASWMKTTRLAKHLAKSGLELDCSPLKGADLLRWLNRTANDTYGVKLDRDAAALLVELAGEEPGLLDQELSKLSSYVGERKQVHLDDVRGLVGGWRVETTWAMTDAVRDADLPAALEALDQLLNDGEAPLKLLGGIGFVFRKLARATEMSRTQSFNDALKSAGVFPRDLAPVSAYLRRIGRAKAERIISLLVNADAGLKGSSRLPDRVQLERLLIELSGLA